VEQEKKNKYYALYVIILVILLVVITIGITYAFFSINVTNSGSKTGVQTSAACIDITYSETDTINLDYNYPISDDYALNNVKPVTIKVENKCTNNNENINYTLAITSLSNDEGFIDDSKIRIYVERQMSGGLEGPFLITDYLNSVQTLTNGATYEYVQSDLDKRDKVSSYKNRNSYLIDSNNIADGKINTYKIYLWVDYYEGDATHTGLNDNSTEGQKFAAAISLVINAKEEVTNEIVPEYENVEYIEFMGNSYINTGFKPNPTTTQVETTFQVTNTEVSNQALFGSRGTANITDTTSTNIFFNTQNSQLRLDWNGNGGQAVAISLDSDIHMICVDDTITINGEVFSGNTLKSTEYLNYSMYIGNFNNAGAPYKTGSYSKFKSFKIWDGDVLVRDFVPVKRTADEKIGMLDLLNNIFYSVIYT